MAGRRTVLTAVVGVLLLASACSPGGAGSSSDGVSLPTATIPAQAEDAVATALVPAAIAAKGKLVFGMDANFAPMEFLAPGGEEMVGMDVDLGIAIAQVLGLDPVLENVGFDTIITGMLANRYDVGLSSFTDTVAREEVVDFVNYFDAGEAFYVKAGSPAIFTSTESLCGHSVAVQAGTIEDEESVAASAACTEAGEEPVDVQSFPHQNAVSLAVSSGRADVGFADSPVVGYLLATTSGMFEPSGSADNFAPLGIAVRKGSSLAFAVRAALEVLIANGTYGAIMAKWGTESGAITEAGATINGAGNGAGAE